MPSLTKIQTGFLEPQGAFELTPGTSSSPGLFFTGDTSTGMFSPSSGVLGFSTGSTQQALTILADGKVGIGTNNPLEKLDIRGNVYLPSSGYISKSFDDAVETLILRGRGGEGWVPGITYTSSNSTANRGYKFGAYDNSGTFVPWMTLWNGDLGINTTSPSNKLHVKESNNNTIVANLESSVSYAYLSLEDSSTTTGHVRVGAHGNDLVLRAGNDNHFRITSTGNIGVGTDNPGDKFEVWGNIRLDSSGTTSRQIYFRNQDTSSTGGGQITSDQYLSLWAGDGSGTPSQYLTIKPGGNVGIGTTNPWDKLVVYGGGIHLGIAPSSDNSARFTYNTLIGNLDISAHSIGGNTYTRFLTSLSGVVEERVRIDSSGNVGIGTTNPDGKLDVRGDLYVGDRGSTDAVIEIGSGRTSNGYAYLDIIGDTTYTDYGLRIIRGNSGENTGSGILHRGTGELYLNATDAGSIAFFTSNAPRVKITSAGNVGIGTTNPIAQFHVGGTASNNNPWAVFDVSDSYFKKLEFSEDRIGYGLGAYGAYVGYHADFNTLTLGVYENSVESKVLNIKRDNGNVGIGTTNPSTKLDVYNGSTDSDTLRVYNDEVGINMGTWGTGSSYPRTVTINGTRFDNGSAPKLRIGGQDGIEFAVDLNNVRAVINSTGNVGIGTNSPYAKTHIEIDAAAAPDSGSAAALWLKNKNTTDGNSATIFAGNNSSEACAAINFIHTNYTNNAGEISFSTRLNNATYAERMRIRWDGYTKFTGVVEGDQSFINDDNHYYDQLYLVDSTWNSGWQWIVPGGTVAGGTTYLVRMAWSYAGLVPQAPWEYSSAFIWRPVNSNSSGQGAEPYVPLASTHIAGIYYLSVRSRPWYPHVMAGLEVNFSWVPPTNSQLYIGLSILAN